MSLENVRFRPSFQAKILISVITLLILLPAITVALVYRSSMEALSTQSRQALNTADALFQNFLGLHSRQLIARYKSIVSDSRFQAVSGLRDGQGDAKTMRDHLNDRLEAEEFSEDAELAVFFNAEGEPFASASKNSQIKPSEFQRAISGSLEQAFGGQPVSVVLPVGSTIYNAIAVPTFAGQRPSGVLVVGVRMSLKMLHELTALIGGEGVFLANHTVAASTLRSPVQAGLLPYWPADLKAPAVIQPVEIESVHYLAIASRLRGAVANAEVGYVLLLSYETALQQLHRAQATLWLLCLVGVAISTGVISVVIRKITAPLRELRLNAEAIGAGDFTRKIQVRSVDEIGQLTHAFNQMTRNLRASHNELQSTVQTLKATQAQLIQSEKLSAVGEFVSGIAHELNNPLTAVIGFGEMLGQANLEPKYRAYLSYIVRSTERCHKIVHGLLSFARQHPPERKVLAVNPMVDDVVELLAYEMRTSNIEVQRNFQTDLSQIIGDSHQLQQVILNILNNARQAIEAHQSSGRIQIATQGVADAIRITIEDNGPGISQENVAKIFNPFFTTKPVGKGTGLGLSLCYGIIREHGGSITAQSEPGKGARFVIELPAHKDSHHQNTLAGRMGGLTLDGAGKRALVIDDEEWILELVRQILNRDGFEVDVAIDGNVALDRISQSRYELLVCDWKMPGLSGPQLFDRISSISPEAANRVIFMTGDVVSDSIQQFLRKHSKRCLSKPFSVDEFRQTIGDFITARN
jgi:two-component system NtrC family sensor kinase